jgi:GTP pyrophosphokinase
MKSELEDLSFRYLQPTAYEEVKVQVKQKKKERQRYIEEVVNLLSRELGEHGVKGDVVGRPKSFFSIYSKMQLQGLTFDEIYDLIAFRIIVPTTMDCYAALGVVHAAWKPIPGRFKDYIAMPKPNGYQSLHTAVFGPKGSRIEIQIRTQEMHDIAEKGIAAHWIYKESEGGQKKVNGRSVEFTWLKDLLESESLLRDPVEFMSLVKDDLFPHEVYVFSPKGDLIALPQDSTAIDFAYRIHSEVGHHCAGARINGQQVALSYKLQNGDSVEILTSKNQVPHKDWLRLAVSSKAKQRIRSWLKTEERLQSVSVGRELLAKDLRKVKLGLAKLEKDGRLKKIAKDLGYHDTDLLFAEVGYGKLNTARVVERLLPEEADIEEKLAEEETALQRIFQRAASAFRERSGIKVSGMDGVVFRFARCCDPLPGDELVGFITRGRGVTIHKRGCAQTMSFDPRRLVDVTWDTSVKTVRNIQIQVYSVDRAGLLAALTNCISAAGVKIMSAQVSSLPNGQWVNSFELKVESVAQVDAVIRGLQRVRGVVRVERTSSAHE